ncbi:eukaryotic translation initiation factor 4 gamma 2-like [Sinocyclocheilus grahami]|uniref:eukaryotic translation initiation factor 4 gamma 2-like n=1 Tax=Sinocyclocheilus grahami TaxID=75366 RepID=UPI0007AD5E58|nr:PREDICTED: eukaryotic translation initiation factor 4 gamma 2-like [Sinocyclocheilus grahami]
MLALRVLYLRREYSPAFLAALAPLSPVLVGFAYGSSGGNVDGQVAIFFLGYQIQLPLSGFGSPRCGSLSPTLRASRSKCTRGQSLRISPPRPLINILLKILRCQAAKVESVIAEGGASRFSASSGGGGGRGASQHFPKTVGNSEYLGKTPGPSVQRWVPSRSTRRDVNTSNEKEHHDAIFRKVRGILNKLTPEKDCRQQVWFVKVKNNLAFILNKLTPEKFDKLCLELLNVGVDSKLVLKGIILLIVDKALEEPKYSSLYAQLCLRLAEDAPKFDGQTPEIQSSQKQSTVST